MDSEESDGAISANDKVQEHLYKVLVIGDFGVGKSTGRDT